MAVVSCTNENNTNNSSVISLETENANSIDDSTQTQSSTSLDESNVTTQPFKYDVNPLPADFDRWQQYTGTLYDPAVKISDQDTGWITLSFLPKAGSHHVMIVDNTVFLYQDLITLDESYNELDKLRILTFRDPETPLTGTDTVQLYTIDEDYSIEVITYITVRDEQENLIKQDSSIRSYQIDQSGRFIDFTDGVGYSSPEPSAPDSDNSITANFEEAKGQYNVVDYFRTAGSANYEYSNTYAKERSLHLEFSLNSTEITVGDTTVGVQRKTWNRSSYNEAHWQDYLSHRPTLDSFQLISLAEQEMTNSIYVEGNTILAPHPDTLILLDRGFYIVLSNKSKNKGSTAKCERRGTPGDGRTYFKQTCVYDTDAQSAYADFIQAYPYSLAGYPEQLPSGGDIDGDVYIRVERTDKSTILTGSVSQGETVLTITTEGRRVTVTYELRYQEYG